MEVELHLFGPFRDRVGEKTIVREVSAGATVGEVLASLADDVPELGENLYDGGELSESVNITVNKRNVKQLDRSETCLTESDVLRLAPPVAGG